MGYQQYSEQFKKAAVQKLLTRGSRSVELIEQDTGASKHSLYKWAKEYGKQPGMKKSERRPEDWSAAEKLQAVIEFERLEPEKQGEFLRRKGVHSDHIAKWKQAMEAGLSNGSVGGASRQEISQLRAQNRELERELNRKDKALAETTALLVLQKKAQAIFGSNGDE